MNTCMLLGLKSQVSGNVQLLEKPQEPIVVLSDRVSAW